MKPGRPWAPLQVGGGGRLPALSAAPLPSLVHPHPHQPTEQLLLSPESSPLAGVIKNDLLIMQAAD